MCVCLFYLFILFVYAYIKIHFKKYHFTLMYTPLTSDFIPFHVLIPSLLIRSSCWSSPRALRGTPWRPRMSSSRLRCIYSLCNSKLLPPCVMVYYIVSGVLLMFFWSPCMAINVSVQYNGGLLPDIILLTQCYFHRGTRLNAMERFCNCSL